MCRICMFWATTWSFHSYSPWSCTDVQWDSPSCELPQLEQTDMFSHSSSLSGCRCSNCELFRMWMCFCLFYSGRKGMHSRVWSTGKQTETAQPRSIIGICSWMWRGWNAYPPKPFLLLMEKEHMDTSFRAQLWPGNVVVQKNSSAAMQNFP